MMRKGQATRLIFLLPTFTFGGAERTSLNLLRGIDKGSFRISLVTSRNIFPYFRDIDIEKFLPVEDLGIGVWFTTLRRFLRDARTIASFLKEEKQDLAFGMMHYPSSLLVCAKKIFSLGIKVVVSPRGPSTEYLRYFEQNLFRKMWLQGTFRFFHKYADGLIVASHGMKEDCARFHADPARIEVVPNSVDLDDPRIKDCEDADIDIPSGFKVVATSGRLEREKDTSFLLQAFSAARKQEKLKLIIIGDGSEKERLAGLAHQLGIGGDVLFPGHQSNPFKFIKKSDIFVHTCLFEGFANAIIEAMACRIPVIAIDCPYGPRDIITHGENGFLIPMNDRAALVNTLLMLARDTELRGSVAGKGYARAADFSVGRMVDGYESFFKHTVSGG
jgi:glycosyltransferase involved in cell wall biosynthesis